ncbi:hypothetical protein C9374_002814 [Naegleria lovaniensis]|uniref:Histidine kinase n=1 Tax=Naegleria lovaniensis TaxID=51637 RepID=A0AA88GUS6_NAELO|nr:uncharacterized protein C9374_002814 [Naegleria lovaniensis]KAG2386368.1 hypothetical protein C9374_002814 [Naegleria lovaniensis]
MSSLSTPVSSTARGSTSNKPSTAATMPGWSLQIPSSSSASEWQEQATNSVSVVSNSNKNATLPTSSKNHLQKSHHHDDEEPMNDHGLVVENLRSSSSHSCRDHVASQKMFEEQRIIPSSYSCPSKSSPLYPSSSSTLTTTSATFPPSPISNNSFNCKTPQECNISLNVSSEETKLFPQQEQPLLDSSLASNSSTLNSISPVSSPADDLPSNISPSCTKVFLPPCQRRPSLNSDKQVIPDATQEALLDDIKDFFKFLHISFTGGDFSEYASALTRETHFLFMKSFKYLNILLGLSVILMVYYFKKESRSIFLICFTTYFEPIIHVCCTWLTISKVKTLTQKKRLTIARCLASTLIAFIVHTYYEVTLLYVVTLTKIIVFCYFFNETLGTTIFNCCTMIFFTALALFCTNTPWYRIFEITAMLIFVSTMNIFISHIQTLERDGSLREKIEHLQEKILSQEKTKFIGNLSHEARNPLHGILGAATIMKNEYEKCESPLKHKRKSRRRSVLHQRDQKPSDQEDGLSDTDSTSSDGTSQSHIELVNDIYNNANLLLQVFSTSLQLSSLEIGNVSLNYEAFSVQQLIESVTSVFYTIANDKKVALHSYVNLNNLPLHVIGDHVKISQVLMNLVSNSIKYSLPNGGHVTVSCSKCDDSELIEEFKIDKHCIINAVLQENPDFSDEDFVFLKFECKDDGKGIKPDCIKDLFQPFKTIQEVTIGSGESTTSPSVESSGSLFDQYYLKSLRKSSSNSGLGMLLTNRNGIGLSISKRLVDRMHGTIAVSSNISPGSSGTTITIIVPVRIGNAEASLNSYESVVHQEDLETLKSKLSPFTVFLIDSDNIFLDIVEKYLRFVSHECHVVKIPSILNDNHLPVNPHSKVLIIYQEDMHKQVKNVFSSVSSCNRILMPISTRGRTRRYPNLVYITKPLKIEELYHTLAQQLISFCTREVQKQFQQGESMIVVPEVSITIDESASELPQHTSIHSPNPNESSGSHKEGRILVVDDNQVNRRVMSKMMHLLGFKDVDSACDGKECFEMFQTKQYDVILMDLLMPNICGKQCVTMIREYEKSNSHLHVPIIAVTANIWENVTSLSEIGFDSVLYKPILMTKLKEVVEKCLDEKAFDPDV